jgi:23S rRNA (adenine2503-C2)-methyltransferase
MSDGKKVLLGMTVAELRDAVKALGMPAFTGGQIGRWLYQQHVSTIDSMTNLSKQNRELLKAHFVVGAMEPIDCQRSVDGTVKYLFPVRCSDNDNASGDVCKYVETVFIPERQQEGSQGEDSGHRATLCVSSQVGCKMNCQFCQTGKQGFDGNLSAADILNQIYSLPEREQLTNVVFMGQGEPMDNLEAVLRATQILTAGDGYQWSPKRITVSSVGIPGKLKRFLDESQCHVAVSMHSPLHEQRLAMMPAEKAMPIAEVVGLLRQYDFTHQRRCSFEYICFGGLNDSLAHGREIVKLVEGLECRVNLIRFHAIPGVDLPGADEQRMLKLRDYLTAHGVFSTIRASRGQDIFAACGLLSTAKKNGITIQLNSNN